MLDPNTKIVDLEDETLLDVYALTDSWLTSPFYMQQMGGEARKLTMEIRGAMRVEILRRMKPSETQKTP
jgi:hypothetical protein